MKWELHVIQPKKSDVLLVAEITITYVCENLRLRIDFCFLMLNYNGGARPGKVISWKEVIEINVDFLDVLGHELQLVLIKSTWGDVCLNGLRA